MELSEFGFPKDLFPSRLRPRVYSGPCDSAWKPSSFSSAIQLAVLRTKAVQKPD